MNRWRCVRLVITSLTPMVFSVAIPAFQDNTPPEKVLQPAKPSEATAQKTGDVKAGQQVYAKKCRSCHGPTGEGNPRLAKMLQVPIRDLGSPEVQQKSDEELRKNTVEGVGQMSAVKDLSDADSVNIVAYIRSLKK